MTAYRQAKRMQRGVKLGENQVTTTATKFTTAPIQIGTEDFSVEFYGNSFGSDGNLGYSFIRYAGGSTLTNNAFNILSRAGANGLSVVQFGNRTISSLGYVNTNENGLFHLVLTRSGVTLTIYIDGTKFNEFTMDNVSDFGTMDFLVANSRNVGFVRVWNMCLSADDVTAHYNNSDPMGYVVPKLYRQFGPNIEPTADTFEFNIGSPYYNTVLQQQSYPSDCLYRVDYVVDEWDYQPERYNVVGFGGVGGASIIAGYYIWYTLSQSRIGESQYCIVKMPGTGSPGLRIYGGQETDATTSRRLKVTIKGITPVGLLAEYLPQNLMAPRKYKFPLDSFTQSANTFSCSASTANKIYDNPQANGFSGKFMRFEAITDITLTCSYYIDVVQRAYPIRVTAEYRSNADLIGGYSSGPVIMSKNEGEASIVSFDIPNGISNSEYIRCADNPEAWLEMRILSIEPIPNMATSWLDSAKQLPLSDEYMEPLFQSIGGYDMAANGAPEILYKE